MRTRIVFLEGGPVDGFFCRALNFLGIPSLVFMSRSEAKAPKSGSLPVPIPGSVVQSDFNKIFNWFVGKCDFTYVDSQRLESLLGPPRLSDCLQSEELIAVLLSRLGTQARTIAHLKHFFGSNIDDLLAICHSRRQCRALKEALGIRALFIPRVPPIRRLVLKFTGRHRVPSTNRILYASELASGRVALLEHKGPGYGRLFSWTQYGGGDGATPLLPDHLVRLDYGDLDASTLTLREKTISALGTLWATLRLWRVFRRSSPDLRSSLLFEAARLGFEIRTARLAIRKRAPNLGVVLYAYDMLVPPGLAIALGAEGVTRIATLERQNVHLTGLPVIVDDWLVPSNEIAELSVSAVTISAKRVHPVGFWRSDFFFRDIHQEVEDPRCDVLVLPYHVQSSAVAEYWDLITSPSAFTHFIGSVIRVSLRYPELNFLIRTKDDHWVEDQRLHSCREMIESQPNVQVDITFDHEGQTYDRAARARLVIGKYTSLMDEALSFGKPVVVHNFDHFDSHQFGIRDLPLPWSCFAQSQEQFETLIDVALRDSPDFSPPEPLCDGNVRNRIRRVVEQEFGHHLKTDPGS